MDVKKIGKFIATCRKKCGLTQEEMAKQLNVSSSSITKWENGYYSPDISLLIPISEILKVTLEELLKGEFINYDTKQKVYYDNKLESIRKLIIFLCIISIICFSIIIINNYFNYKKHLKDDFIVNYNNSNLNIKCM